MARIKGMELNFGARQRRALTRLRKSEAAVKAGAKALLVTHMPDVRYLCGFTGSNGALVLGAGKATLYTDGRYTVQAKAEAVGTRVVIAPRSATLAACAALEAAGVTRCGFDATQTTVAALEAMRGAVSAKLRKRLFVPVGPVVAELREVKDEIEIEVIRRAAGLGCRLLRRCWGRFGRG